MANTFKSAMAASIGTTAVAVYTTPPTTKSILIELDVANISNDAVVVDIGIGTLSAIQYHIVKGAVIPAGDSLQVVSGQKIVLDGSSVTQKIFVKSSVVASIDCIGSVLEDVQ